MVAFLSDAIDLIRRAMLARDKGEEMTTHRAPDGTEVTKAGVPFDDDIPSLL